GKNEEPVRSGAVQAVPEPGILVPLGRGGSQFADQGHTVTCVDLSPEMVGLCRAEGLAAEVMDFNALAFADGSFDAVFGMNCLLHVPRAELDGILREVGRVLAPGGLFYWGQYGGKDSEEVYPEGRYEPKRFFSLMTAERISAVAAEHFELLDFVVHEPDYTELEFHGLVLRRSDG
ncbi:class I SAM-dependent methyltransferase, partial [Glycomyces sp. L485]|uniref:class I SAM-dependent methyltransferase n=1 Tax=Glycomyces sp. L485 TaxID=2909235 RepID=UPI001F4B27F3